MPRSKAGIKKPPPPAAALEEAANDCISGMSIRTAADKHQVSKSTLSRFFKKKRDEPELHYTPNYATNQVFTVQEEADLVQYIEKSVKMNYGLTVYEAKKLAFHFASANGKKVPTWELHKKAGDTWMKFFMKRHPTLSLRKAEATSLARASAFNKTTVGEFFTNLQEVMKKGLDPSQIWNLDETGCSTVHVPPKVIATKGVKQVASVTSGERGINVTMIAAVNASGNSVPPLFVFPRVFFKEHMLKGAPPGSKGAANPSGWSTSEIFLQYLDHFINHVKPNLQQPHLIIMDNHESHVTIQAIDKAKDNNIIFLTLPPHTSHRLQPLDRTVFGPFKSFYSKAMAEWMATAGNTGKPVTIYEVAEIAGRAYENSFNLKNIINGFKCTGIVPLNPDIFSDDKFLPSAVTDRPQPSGSNEQQTSQCNVTTPSKPTSGTYKSPEELRPFPKAGERKTASGRGRRRAKSAILTSTPVKNELIEFRTKSKKEVKRKIILSSSSSSDEVPDLPSSDDVDFGPSSDESQDLEQIEVGDYLLINCNSEKGQWRKYVGKVDQLCQNGDFSIKFLKKMQKTEGFIYDEAAAVYSCSKADILRKLPLPGKVGGTKRAQNLLKFSVALGDCH